MPLKDLIEIVVRVIEKVSANAYSPQIDSIPITKEDNSNLHKAHLHIKEHASKWWLKFRQHRSQPPLSPGLPLSPLCSYQEQ